MINSKLVAYLKVLKPKEIKEFRLFLNSPYYNDQESIVDLFEHCINDYPKFPDEKLDRNYTFNILFPKKKFDNKILRYEMTNLTKLLEKYLIHKQLDSDKTNEALLLLKALNNKELDNYFLQTLDKHKKDLLKKPIRDIPYYLNQYKLNDELASLEFRRQNHSNIEYLLSTVDDMDKFYIANKLKYACLIINYKNVLNADYEPIFIEDISKYIEQKNFQDEPTIYIYYLILKMLREIDNEQYFNLLIEQLLLHQGKFSLSEVDNMYSYARNFCVRKINSGNNIYYHHLFDLYKTMLKQEVLLKDGDLSPWDYYNISILSLRIKNFEFAENFIQEYRNKIKEQERDNIYTFMLANLQFHKKNFDKTLKLLNRISFSDTNYHLMTKCLMIKTYYENEEVIPLFSLLDTFIAFANRNRKISSFHKKLYANFAKVVKKMAKIKMGSKIDPEKLRAQIMDDRLVADLVWINEKLDELSAKYK